MGKETVSALSGIDLEILQGEFVAILGPSGSGKSTLLHIIGALDTATSGSIQVADLDLMTADSQTLARYRNRNIGFVFQSFHLHPSLTAVENVCLPLAVAGVDRKPRKEIAEKLLAEVGLENRSNHRPGELSGGQQQRVSIARALAVEPRILLADEPTGNLDSKTSSEMINLFVSLQKEHGITLVLVTHDADIAKRADRIIHLLDGKVVSDTRQENREIRNHIKSLTVPAGRMRWMDRCRDIFLNLFRQKLRTALTACGFAIGALAITLMLGLALGLQAFILRNAGAVNDPLSLIVRNMEFSVGDIIRLRAESFGRPPVPIKPQIRERLSQLRRGIQPFSQSQVDHIKSLPGIQSVRPRTMILLDGIRLVTHPSSVPDDFTPSDKNLLADDIHETFYLGYALVRGHGTPFFLSAGRSFHEESRREVVLSYQYIQAWGLSSPDSLLNRQVEILVPDLTSINRVSVLRKSTSKPQMYRTYRVQVVGVTKKSILSSVAYIPPDFGEEIRRFQFGRNSSSPTEMAIKRFRSLTEPLEALQNPDPLKRLDAGNSKEKELSKSLRVLITFQEQLLNPESGGKEPEWISLFLAYQKISRMMKDVHFRENLHKSGKFDPKWLKSVERLFDPKSDESETSSKDWGSTLRVQVQNEKDLLRVRESLDGMGYQVRSLSDDFSVIDSVFSVVHILLSAFGLIALVVASFGIVNTLFMSIIERTREIGLLKALGTTDGDIRMQFAGEALGIGLLGGTLGALTGLVIGMGFDRWGIPWILPGWNGYQFFECSVPLLIGIVGFCSLVGLFAGLYPAKRASQLSPVRALRSE
jgi:putative ABC transport system ATP-binding protein